VTTWWPLLPLGVTAWGMLGHLAWRDTSWREEPVRFAFGLGVLGACYLAGLALVRSRTVPRLAVAWILVVGVGLNLLGTGLWHSDDLYRYAVEGRQVLAGQNPYALPPADSAARSLVDPRIAERVNHPQMTAIYPPVAVAVHAGVQAVKPGLWGFTVLACACALVASGAALILLRRLGQPEGLVLAVAWHPVLPVFISGEAHHDILAALGVLAMLVLLRSGRPWLAHVVVALAALVKPFALAAVPALIQASGWRRLAWLPFIALVSYLPFLGAGSGLYASLVTFGGSMHFHGALDPWLRLAGRPLLSEAWLEPLIRVVLATVLLGGGAWLWRRRHGLTPEQLAIAGLGLLLVCLPTLHPWYLSILVVLLPWSRSWALPVWTVWVPLCYWLHGAAMLRAGTWIEDPWVTASAHLLPALVWLGERWRRTAVATHPC
jgi:hypothetical protein